MAKRKRRNFKFKAEVVLEALAQANCVGATTSAKSNFEVEAASLASVFASTDKHSREATERIAQLEQLYDAGVGASTLLS